MTDDQTEAPEPIRPLGPQGRALWDRLSEWRLTVQEVEYAQAAAEATDRLEECERRVADEGATIRNERSGAIQKHPLLAESRMLRESIARLVGKLDLPEEGESSVRTTYTSMRAQRAARARWGRRG